MNKKLFLIGSLFVMGTFGCKKKIDEIKTDALIEVVSSHNWKIIEFYVTDTSTRVKTEKSADYANYLFDFNENLHVDVFQDATLFASGTWNGIMGTGLSNSTIIADFPTAGYPIDVMTGTWQTTNSNGNPLYFRAMRFVGNDSLSFKMQAVD